MMLQIRHPSGRDPEWTYILHVVFNEYFGIAYEAAPAPIHDVEVRLTGDATARMLRVASQLLTLPDDRWLTPSSLPGRPLTWTTPAEDAAVLREFSDRVPVLYGTRCADGRFISTDQNAITLGIDVFGSAFFMLTRYEEYRTTDLDHYGRFPSSSSLAVREGFHHVPIAQVYFEILWTCMRALWPRLSRVNRTYRVIMTHDIDTPASRMWPTVSVLKHVAGDLTFRREPKIALRRLAGLAYTTLTDRSPSWDVLNTFPFLMGSAEQFGLTTMFNVLPLRSTVFNDASYSVDDPTIREILRSIRERGHGVGYHATFRAFEQQALLQKELAELRRVSAEEGITQNRWGGRHHFLKWRNPDTWQSWNDTGCAFDSTLGYSDEVGFRCGCCFEFPVFNLITRRMLSLREQPLVFMDVALSENRGMAPLAIVDTIRSISGVCRRFQGEFVVLWHNTSVVGQKEKRMYLDILSEIV
jgi:hypothetical protein